MIIDLILDRKDFMDEGYGDIWNEDKIKSLRIYAEGMGFNRLIEAIDKRDESMVKRCLHDYIDGDIYSKEIHGIIDKCNWVDSSREVRGIKMKGDDNWDYYISCQEMVDGFLKDGCILCNEITNHFEWDEYNCASNTSEYQQTYIISSWGAELLINFTDEPVLYCDELCLWVWVPQFINDWENRMIRIYPDQKG